MVSKGQKKLAIFHPTMTVGGAERVVIHLANGFVERGYNVDLVLANANGELLNRVDSDVDLIDLSSPQVPGIGVAASIPGLAQYLRQKEPDSLFTAGNHVNIPAIIAHQISNSDSKLVISEHNSPLSGGYSEQDTERNMKNQLLYWSEKYLYPKADHIVAVSNGTANELSKVAEIPRDCIDVVYNPVITPEIMEKAKVDIDHNWFNNESTPVVLSVGSLSSRKDYSTLVRSFKLIREERDDAKLVIVGRDGGKRAELDNLTQSLGLSDVIEMPGYVENPFAYMANADVFVLSSVWEGFGNVLVEAMACGCPVVSTDCPSGPSEILSDGRYGPLTPIRDPESLKKAVLWTLENPLDKESLQNRAYDFSLDKSINYYEKIFF